MQESERTQKLRSLMGMDSGERTPMYKLNKVQMSGDDGSFRLIELLSDKDENNKYPVKDLGKEIDGVILKMRWQLTKYEEDSPSLNSTEYDNKFKDEVVVFPMKEKGNAAAMKEKHALQTVRIIYLYMPKLQQIVRLIVKASALTNDKNPNPDTELGLFNYTDSFADTDTLPCEFITTCQGVFREDTKNKRKSYYAMTFKTGRKLTESEFAKVEKMMLEVNEKTMSPKPIEDEMEQQDKALDEALASEDDIASSIPF